MSKLIALLSTLTLLGPSAAPPTADPQPATPASPPTFSVVLLSASEAPRLVEVTRRQLATTEPGTDAWVWSPQLAPRLVTSSELPAFRPRPDRQRLTVRVRPSYPRDTFTDLRCLAAPVDMWREVPEDLLPSFKVPTDGRLQLPVDPEQPWRLRLVGQGRGSLWLDLPAGQQRINITPVTATDHSLVVADQAGNPLADSLLSLLRAEDRHDRQQLMSQLRGSDNGTLRVPALPPGTELFVVVGADGHAPQAFRTRSESLQTEVRLAPGLSLHGRLTDPDNHPLAGEVSLEGWIAEGISVPYRRAIQAADDGSWRLERIPASAGAVLVARAKGYATQRRELFTDGPPADPEVNLGNLVLAPGRELALKVVNALDSSPIANAQLRLDAAQAGRTGSDGSTRLIGLSADRTSRLRVEALGFLPLDRDLRPPWPEQLTLQLMPAFRVTGWLLRGDGTPLADGQVAIHVGNRFETQELPPDGRIELFLPPGSTANLTFNSPQTATFEVPVTAAEAGAQLDLGELYAPAGLTVRGRLLRADDVSPVAGARLL